MSAIPSGDEGDPAAEQRTVDDDAQWGGKATRCSTTNATNGARNVSRRATRRARGAWLFVWSCCRRRRSSSHLVRYPVIRWARSFPPPRRRPTPPAGRAPWSAAVPLPRLPSASGSGASRPTTGTRGPASGPAAAERRACPSPRSRLRNTWSISARRLAAGLERALSAGENGSRAIAARRRRSRPRRACAGWPPGRHAIKGERASVGTGRAREIRYSPRRTAAALGAAATRRRRSGRRSSAATRRPPPRSRGRWVAGSLSLSASRASTTAHGYGRPGWLGRRLPPTRSM